MSARPSRNLPRRPTQTVLTVIMLAVGIGANGAVFAIVNAALFKGFAFVLENERLVQISTSTNGNYVPDVLDWRAHARSFVDRCRRDGTERPPDWPGRMGSNGRRPPSSEALQAPRCCLPAWVSIPSSPMP